MRASLAIRTAACAVLLCALVASPTDSSAVQTSSHAFASPAPVSRADTLWIFDADFENLIGDNAGWLSDDLSDRPARANYWHKDTIRINGFEHLGDSTWWCGTYNDCWRQPRGYGNNWSCSLERALPEVAALTEPGDAMTLEYDQRYAMEKDYDYGYVEVSTDGGENWASIHGVTNSGFFETPGFSEDWDSDHWGNPGHMVLDLSAYAGGDMSIRFRFESDAAYSSEDEDNTPPRNTCLDGAWQLDNITITAVTAAAGSILVFRDDCESPGDHGWNHEDLLPDGQTGVVFARSFESFDGHSGWMMTACDSVSGTMVDGQYSRLRSPLIYIEGAPEIVVVSTGWLDLGTSGEDRASLHFYGAPDTACLWYGGAYGGWYESGGGPIWTREEIVSEHLIDQSWLGLRLRLYNTDPIGTGHGVGFALDRVRVGVPLATGAPDVGTFEDRILAVRPNPFNPQTTVDFAVAREGSAALRVYDVSGRLIRTLVEGRFEPGEYESSWDGADDSGERVASGVYMLRLELHGGESASLKAVLLK